MSKKRPIEGPQIELAGYDIDGERSVHCSKVIDGKVLFVFKNGDIETPIKLSLDALYTMFCLYQDQVLDGKLI